MPVGAGSIKRAAKTAAAKPEVEKTEEKQAEVKAEAGKAKQQETNVGAKSATEKQAAQKKKPGRKPVSGKYGTIKKQSKTPAQTAEKAKKGPERLGNQVYHITDELPVHLL